MAANEKRVVGAFVLTVIDEHSGRPPIQARVNVEAKSVAHALKLVEERTMAQLKGKR